MTTKTWRPQTKAVRSGQTRSNFDETSEALFLTSGYVYRSAEEAEVFKRALETAGFIRRSEGCGRTAVRPYGLRV